MNASAAIVDPLLRRASGQRVRPSDLHRTARVRIGYSGLRALVSRLDSEISQRIVMNNAGLPSKIDEEPAILFSHLFRGHPWTC